MTRNLASAFAIACDVAAVAAAATIVVCITALADDTTVGGTPFISAGSRAEVQSDFSSQAQLATPGTEDGPAASAVPH